MHHQLVLPDAGGGKGRQKRKKSDWDPQGTAGTILSFAGFAAAQEQMQIPPPCPSQDMRNQADSAESPKQGEPSASLEPLNEHSQPKGTKPIISPLRTGIQSRAQTTPGQARAKQPHSLLYFTCAPLGREGSAEEREQQPRTHGTATL